MQLPYEVVRDESKISVTETREANYLVFTCVQKRLAIFRKSYFRNSLGTLTI